VIRYCTAVDWPNSSTSSSGIESIRHLYQRNLLVGATNVQWGRKVGTVYWYTGEGARTTGSRRGHGWCLLLPPATDGVGSRAVGVRNGVVSGSYPDTDASEAREPIEQVQHK
jgi:hypothetical protein